MSKKVVHVVDDDAGVRNATRMVLELSGYEVRTYDRASAFLACAAAATGCVLSDMRMPDMNGLELRQRLRGQQVGLPLIFMTGALEHDRNADVGTVAILTKPFDLDVLIETIEHALGQSC